jgi:prepilin-type N-terminal cleavage/methylation domain-containing protein
MMEPLPWPGPAFRGVLECAPLRRRRSGGFSLLEMLVASALLVVIMLGLLAMFYQTQRAFRIGTQQADILDNGRAVLELMTRDLQEMSASDQPGVTNFLVYPTSLVLNQQMNASEVRGNYLQPFYFLSKVNREWKGIRYDFRTPDAQAGVGVLYRLEMTMPYTNSSALSLRMAKNDADNSLPGYGRIADGIIHLAIRCYDRQGNLVAQPGVAFGGPIFSYIFANTNLPAAVEIELGILEPKALEQFRAMTPANQANYLNRLAGQVHLFRQRIPIRSAP